MTSSTSWIEHGVEIPLPDDRGSGPERYFASVYVQSISSGCAKPMYGFYAFHYFDLLILQKSQLLDFPPNKRIEMRIGKHERPRSVLESECDRYGITFIQRDCEIINKTTFLCSVGISVLDCSAVLI